MHPRAPLHLALLLVLAAGAAGCAAGYDTHRAYPGHTLDAVWVRFVAVVQEEYDIDDLDEERRELRSRWNAHLGPMHKSGKRYRVRGEVREEEALGGPVILVAVDREINTNLDRPLSRASARWASDGFDRNRAEKILQRVRFHLDPIRRSNGASRPEPSPYRKPPNQKDKEKIWGKDAPKESGDESDPWK
jgi:hypothetical protein